MNDVLERNGINTMIEDDFKHEDSWRKAFTELQTVIAERPKIVKELSVFRKYVPLLLDYCKTLTKFNDTLYKTFERYKNDSEEKRYKRWSEEEDDILIEMVCQDRSMLEVSTAMGRTVPSIKSRLTKLVGIKRISQEIAGRFVGTIDGINIDGSAKGTLYR